MNNADADAVEQRWLVGGRTRPPQASIHHNVPRVMINCRDFS